MKKQADERAEGRSADFTVVNCLSAQGDGIANDDVVGHHASASRADFWVIDGATSVADRAYVPGEASDPAWFARRFSAELSRRSAEDEGSVDQLLRGALAATRDSYATAVGGIDTVPIHAWPFAVISFVRVTRDGDHLVMEGRHLGDCSVYASDRNGWTHIWKPGAKGDLPAYLSENLDREALKLRIRHRREEQHSAPDFAVAGLDPDAIGFATPTRCTFERPARLVLMSDGLARLFHEYRLTTAGAVLEALQTKGAAERLVAQLREAERPERAAARPLLYKNSDDASVLSVRFP